MSFIAFLQPVRRADTLAAFERRFALRPRAMGRLLVRLHWLKAQANKAIVYMQAPLRFNEG